MDTSTINFIRRQKEHCTAEEAIDEHGRLTMFALGGFVPESPILAKAWFANSDNRHFKKTPESNKPELRAKTENEARILVLKKLNQFLHALDEGKCNVEKARRLVGVTRAQLDEWRVWIPTFDILWTQIFEAVTDEIESAAFERAVYGVDEEIFGKDGSLAGIKKKYSDGLLIMLLQGRRPQTYRANNALANSDNGSTTEKTIEALRALASGLPD